MFRLQQLLAIVSIISISVLSFSNSGVALEVSNCSITKEQNCQEGRREPEQAKPWYFNLDSEGFPVALSKEVAQLKQAINIAKQRNIDPENDEDVKQAIRALANKMPFAQKYKKLRNAVV